MHPFIIYIIKLVVVSGIFYAYYFLLLRNRKLHTYNRFFILTGFVLSLVIPLLHFEFVRSSAVVSSPAIKLLSVINAGGNEPLPSVAVSGIYVSDLLWFAYSSVAAILFAALAVKIFRLYAIRRSSVARKNDNVNVIYTDLEMAPFSFLNDLYWKTDIDENSANGQSIMRHELVHIQQQHTLDKLFTRITISFFWMNPFFWLLQKELSLVHEFLADEGSIENNDTSAFAAMLLQSHFGNHFNTIIQPFFYSPVKRRLTMLHQTNKTKYAQLRKLLVLPVISATVLLFSFSVKEKALVRGTQKTVLIIDAGHGGTDKGAISAGGLVEKDLNLKVSRAMVRLAPEYNIDVVQTRSGDDYPALLERVKSAQENHADMFISFHVSKNEPGLPPHNGYEIYLSSKSTKYNESRLLASAIMGNLGNGSATLKNKGLTVLKENTVPAILIECGNIDDAKDMATLQDAAQLDNMCRKILSGIVQYKKESAHRH